jgi:hypothetical protein
MVRTAFRIAVVYLPGLTRTIVDFDFLVPAPANDDILTRRGHRDRLTQPWAFWMRRQSENYNIAVEFATVPTVLGVGPGCSLGFAAELSPL